MPSGGHNEIPESKLVQSLRDLAEEIGRSPSQKDINDRSPHSHKTYYRKFDGGLAEAKERAGLEMYEQQGRERVEVECANCGETRKQTPSEVEASTFNYCNQNCHYEHKKDRYAGENNPASTLKSVECGNCGSDLLRPKWKREGNQQHFCSDCWGNIRVPVECAWCGAEKDILPSIAVSERYFCNQQCHGKWMAENQTGENHPRWRPGRRPEYYGPNWRAQRRRAQRRDQYRCQDCGVTEWEYLEKSGEVLSVHHLAPFRKFETDNGWDYKRANKLNNLITVCRRCHMERENEWKVENAEES